MSGIVVGIDGSGHSRRALEWAMREANIRRVPLTVITVHEISVGYWGSGVVTRRTTPWLSTRVRPHKPKWTRC